MSDFQRLRWREVAALLQSECHRIRLIFLVSFQHVSLSTSRADDSKSAPQGVLLRTLHGGVRYSARNVANVCQLASVSCSVEEVEIQRFAGFPAHRLQPRLPR